MPRAPHIRLRGRGADWYSVAAFVLVGCVELVAAGIAFAVGNWWDGATDVILAFAFGNFYYLRRTWIRIGYRRGRASVINSLPEALARGLSPREWIMAEIERDVGHAIAPPPGHELAAIEDDRGVSFRCQCGIEGGPFPNRNRCAAAMGKHLSDALHASS